MPRLHFQGCECPACKERRRHAIWQVPAREADRLIDDLETHFLQHPTSATTTRLLRLDNLVQTTMGQKAPDTVIRQLIKQLRREAARTEGDPWLKSALNANSFPESITD